MPDFGPTVPENTLHAEGAIAPEALWVADPREGVQAIIHLAPNQVLCVQRRPLCAWTALPRCKALSRALVVISLPAEKPHGGLRWSKDAPHPAKGAHPRFQGPGGP